MTVTLLMKAQARDWLTTQGVPDVDEIMKGIDTGAPMYLRWFHSGETLVQYRDRPSHHYPDGALGGRWFALPSHHPEDLGTLGIGSGPAGRSRAVLTVARAFQALETTAKSMSKPNQPAYDRFIGPGGATQVFIPNGGLSCLR